MDVYNYVAKNNPQKASEIISSFGYKVIDRNNMGKNLKSLVANEGEPALKMILENHPDKDVILELYSPTSNGLHYSCPCDGCKEKRMFDKFLNASGQEVSEAKKVETNFSLVFLAGIFALSIAILSKN